MRAEVIARNAAKFVGMQRKENAALNDSLHRGLDRAGYGLQRGRNWARSVAAWTFLCALEGDGGAAGGSLLEAHAGKLA